MTEKKFVRVFSRRIFFFLFLPKPQTNNNINDENDVDEHDAFVTKSLGSDEGRRSECRGVHVDGLIFFLFGLPQRPYRDSPDDTERSLMARLDSTFQIKHN